MTVSTTQHDRTQEFLGREAMPAAYRSYLDCIHWGEKTCPPWVAPFPGWHPDCTNGREGSGSMHSPLCFFTHPLSWDELFQAPTVLVSLPEWGTPRTVNKNKLLLPDAALIRIVYHSIIKETKAMGMLGSLLGISAPERGASTTMARGRKRPQGSKGKTSQEKPPGSKKKNSKKERGMHRSVSWGRVFV